MAGQLTTHALDTAKGSGCAGLKVQVLRDGVALASVTLDEGGRGVLLESVQRGVYDIVFHAADYHRAAGEALADPPFLDAVTIRFGVAEPDAHYHVPLLLTPWSYSTYRGG